MKRFFCFLALVCLFSVDVYAENQPIDLRFEPTTTATPALHLLSVVNNFRGVKIQPFTDKRSVGETLLGSIKSANGVQMLESSSAISVYASEVFRKVYREWGGKSSPDGPLTLKGEITQFAFDDSDGYQAKVGFHFFLCDDSDKILWDGHSSGIVRGSGKTVTAENLSGIFSDILRATYNEMLEDEKLVGVWSGRVSNTYLIKDDATVAPSLSVKNSR